MIPINSLSNISLKNATGDVAINTMDGGLQSNAIHVSDGAEVLSKQSMGFLYSNVSSVKGHSS